MRRHVLVLVDAFVVFDSTEGAPEVIVDPREVDVRRDCASILSEVSSGTREYEDALRSATEAFRARRNQPGGYWIAKDDPAAAGQAVTARVPLDLLNGIALLPNGAGRVVDPYGLTTWSALVEHLRTLGPDDTLRRIRALEATARAADQRPAIPEPDAATIAYCDLSYEDEADRTH